MAVVHRGDLEIFIEERPITVNGINTLYAGADGAAPSIYDFTTYSI